MARKTTLSVPAALLPYTPPSTLDGIEQAIREEIQLLGRRLADPARRLGLLLFAGKKRVGHGKFLTWARAKFQFGDRTARNLMAHARACEKAGRLLPYHPSKSATVAGLESETGKSVEHYTAADCIEAARRVLGTIDLDPASSDDAQQVVRAERYFTKEQDGLKQPWRLPGRPAVTVWCNPPFCGEAAPFVWKLVTEYEARNVTAAVLLLNGLSIPSPWFEPLYGFPYCLTRRIKFRPPGGTEKPVLALTAIIYLGPHRDRFVKEFSRFGPIVDSMDHFEWLYAQVPESEPLLADDEDPEPSESDLRLSGLHRR